MQEGLLQRWVGQGVGNTEGLGCGAGPDATLRLSDSKLQGQSCKGLPAACRRAACRRRSRAHQAPPGSSRPQAC
jgi:hypothetical protein